MRFIIIGCGRMGSGLARLLNVRGHHVTVIDKDEGAFAHLGVGFQGDKIVGIGFDRDVLLAAMVNRADGVASVTNSDEVNIVAARLAREVFHVPRVVARVVDPHKAEIYQRLGLRTISTTTWGVNRIGNLLSYAELDVEYELGSEIELVAAEIPGMLAGRTVYNLTMPGEIHVVAISRGNRTFLPSASTVFQIGDTVHLALLAASADRLKNILRSG